MRAVKIKFSRTDNSGATAVSCGLHPISGRHAARSRTISCPNTSTTPSSATAMPVQILTAVDLPAPFMPNSPKIPRSGTAKLTPSSARISPRRDL